LIAAARKHWFLIGLIVLIPLGVALGQNDPSPWLVRGVDSVQTSVCTGAILFLMSVSLNSGRLLESLKRPRAVLAACGVNQLLLPLLALPLLPLVPSADLRVGLLIAASVPCTMAAASVWTRRAGGNDAVSLLVTLLTNGFCFLITPIWMSIGTRWFDTSDTSGGLQFQDMVLRLLYAALLPAAAGQLLRIPQMTRQLIDRHKPLCSTTAQLIILTLVFISCFRGGLRFQQGGLDQNLRHGEFAFVWFCCVALHLVAMIIAWWLGGRLSLEEGDRRACVFAGSQKTLPIGILVSSATGQPFSLLPMLMYHASQLFVDTWIADRLNRRETASEIETPIAERAPAETSQASAEQ
jgi:sodium/bile acid cotransporter 7